MPEHLPPPGPGRHRRDRRRCWRAPVFATKVARRLRARRLAAHGPQYQPTRQITLKTARRREGRRLGGMWRV